MNARLSPNDLSSALRELRQAWQDLSPHWRDAKAADFQKRWLEPLPQSIHTTKTAMEELEHALNRLIRECE